MPNTIALSDDEIFKLEDAAQALARWIGRLMSEVRHEQPLAYRLVELAVKVDCAATDLRTEIETLTKTSVQ
jgi:hypothetical protein